MISYCSLSAFASTIISIIIACKLYSSYKKNGSKNVEYFFKAFFSVTFYFFLTIFPGWIIQDLILSEIFFILSWIPLYIAIFYLTKMTLSILGLKKLKNIFPLVIILLVLSTVILSTVYFSPAEIIVYNNFSFCFERSPIWLLTLDGLIVAFLLFLNALFFFRGGLKTKEKNARTRSFLIGTGILFISIGELFGYVLMPNFSKLRFLFFASSFFFLIGVITAYLGISHKKSNKKL